LIRILTSFVAKLWAVLALLLILIGLGVLAARLLLPLAAEYRESLAAEFSAALGAPVRIEGLGTRLAGLAPELQLNGVEVLDPASGEPRLRFRELRLRLAPWESLRTWSLRVELATLVGARLWLRRETDGALLLSSLESDPGAAPPAPPLMPAFGAGRLRLLDSEILWENRRLHLPPLLISGVEAELLSSGDRHQLQLQAKLLGAGAGRLDLRADLQGTLDSPGDWRGDFYFRGHEQIGRASCRERVS
jgi:uncharacterized protein YhdP